jgi:molybdopterin converting factor small subunit
MKVQVQLFSFLRECLPPSAERGRAEVELPDQATIRDLFLQLGLHKSMQSNILESKLADVFEVTVNGASEVNYDRHLQDGDKVVMFPPMAGG